MDVRLNIKLHANQQYIHDNARTFNVIKAGKRFGKTKLAIYRSLQKAGQLPGGVVWYVAPTYKQAKQIAWWELLKMVPPQMIRRKLETDLMVEIYNECRIQLVGADNEDSLRGPRMDHITMDEAAYIKQDVWDSILRGQLLGNDRHGTADFISSPNRTGRNWFTNFHEEATVKMKAGNPQWAAFYYTIYDNPTLPKADIDALRDDIPDDTWNLEYMGIESLHAGQKYSEFNRNAHVKEMDPESEEMKKFPAFRAVDWGLDHPTVCLWAKVDPIKQIVYITDELVKSGLLIQEIVSVIKQKTNGTPVEWTVIDPSANRRDPVTGRSVKDEYSRLGLGCVDGDRRGADNIGGRGVDIVKMFFKKNRILIHPKCKNLIGELRILQWGDKIGDDATDALRYLLIRLHDTQFYGNSWSIDNEPEFKNPGPGRKVFNLKEHLFQNMKNKQDNTSWANAEDNEYQEAV